MGRFVQQNPKIFRAGSTIQLSKALHDGALVLLDQLTGSVVTLPPALGLRTRITVAELIAATSNSHIIKVQNATDVMMGAMMVSLSTGVGTIWPTGATSDTITLNRTTSGGASRGGYFEFWDIAAGIWQIIEASANGSGTLVTPFSATV
jgi:hypothetical protein